MRSPYSEFILTDVICIKVLKGTEIQSGSFIMNIQWTKIVFIIERLHNKRTQLNTNPM